MLILMTSDERNNYSLCYYTLVEMKLNFHLMEVVLDIDRTFHLTSHILIAPYFLVMFSEI
jgi:hypothetical protein